jgi:hypothetical protein
MSGVRLESNKIHLIFSHTLSGLSSNLTAKLIWFCNGAKSANDGQLPINTTEELTGHSLINPAFAILIFVQQGISYFEYLKNLSFYIFLA